MKHYFFHDWVVIATSIRDVNYINELGKWDVQDLMTWVTSQCQYCGRLKQRALWGDLTKARWVKESKDLP